MFIIKNWTNVPVLFITYAVSSNLCSVNSFYWLIHRKLHRVSNWSTLFAPNTLYDCCFINSLSSKFHSQLDTDQLQRKFQANNESKRKQIANKRCAIQNKSTNQESLIWQNKAVAMGYTEDTTMVSRRYLHSGTATSINLVWGDVCWSKNMARDFTTRNGDVEALRGKRARKT